MLYFVYVLKSKKDNKRYIGFTDNLDRRISEHNAGLVKSTRNRRPLELVYFEKFGKKSEAMKREKYFKTGFGRAFLKNKGL
jgi:putative endonuclease